MTLMIRSHFFDNCASPTGWTSTHDDDDDDDDDDGDDVDDDDYNGSHFGDTCTSPADWTSTRWSATWNKCAFYAGSEPSSRASTGETICICICICIYICIYI